MNENEVVQKMIEFIYEKEREVQAAKLVNDNKTKTGIVKSILNELERVMTDEDQ